MKSACAIILVLLSVPVGAETILVPISVRSAPGENGSLWTSHLTVANTGDKTVQAIGVEPCNVGTCAPAELLAGSSFEACAFGTSVEVPEADVENIRLLLRVQDISRQAQTWGTVIPTVPERHAYTISRRVALLDIPTGDAFRSMLRVYDYHPGVTRSVAIRGYETPGTSCLAPGSTDSLLFEAVESFTPDVALPMYAPAQITLPLPALTELPPGRRVRLEVEALSDDLVYWGFVSVTNNATQHVTAIVP